MEDEPREDEGREQENMHVSKVRYQGCVTNRTLMRELPRTSKTREIGALKQLLKSTSLSASIPTDSTPLQSSISAHCSLQYPGLDIAMLSEHLMSPSLNDYSRSPRFPAGPSSFSSLLESLSLLHLRCLPSFLLEGLR